MTVGNPHPPQNPHGQVPHEHVPQQPGHVPHGSAPQGSQVPQSHGQPPHEQAHPGTVQAQPGHHLGHGETQPGPAQPVFVPISPKYITASLLALCIPFVLCLVGAVVIFFVAPLWVGLVATAAVLAVFAFWAFLIVRQAKALGYAEREEDLLIQRGIMFRKTTVVPYGRMQFVDVSAGPIDRIFGLAKVELNTASAKSDAVIPGLERDDADRLRELLAARGESSLAGL